MITFLLELPYLLPLLLYCTQTKPLWALSQIIIMFTTATILIFTIITITITITITISILQQQLVLFLVNWDNSFMIAGSLVGINHLKLTDKEVGQMVTLGSHPHQSKKTALDIKKVKHLSLSLSLFCHNY